MKQWASIRQSVLRDKASKRSVIRETGLHWKTLEKILAHSSPPGYGLSKPREKPKLGPYLHRIEEIIEEDKSFPVKQRHTAQRIFERLREEGYAGGYTQVRMAVKEIHKTRREAFMPLTLRPGEAQVDFFDALVKMGGSLRKVSVFLMALPYSDAFFMAAFEKECTETFQEGHVRAFEFFGGAPARISYDNLRIAVKSITGSERTLTDGFLQLQSFYLFSHRFCRPRRPNEKGVVENTVKYARLNFMVPVPSASGFGDLNAMLSARCADDLKRRVRGK